MLTSKGPRRHFVNHKASRTSRKLRRIVLNLSEKSPASIWGFHHTIDIREEFIRYIFLFFLKYKLDAAEWFEGFLVTFRKHGQVDMEGTNIGVEFVFDPLKHVCACHHDKHELATLGLLKFNGIADERCPEIIFSVFLAA